MQGVEKSHLNAAIAAGLTAFYDFMHSTAGDALKKISAYGARDKKDTLGMDAGPEIIICEELGRYDAGAVVITEEIGSRGKQVSDTFRPNDPQTFRTVFICDPTDRSNQLKEFLNSFPRNAKIGEILGDTESVKKREEKFDFPFLYRFLD